MSLTASFRPAAAAAGLCAALLLAGCASSPVPSWHSLMPTAAPVGTAPAAAAPATSAAMDIHVGRISVPDAVDRSALVVNTTGGLAVLDGERWVEPVKSQLPRLMALLLSERLPGATVSAWPAGGHPAPTWRLMADVQRFDLAEDPARAQLRVVWSLRGASATPPAPRVFDITVAALPGGAGGSQALLVAAMREAVARWADQVAQAAAAPPPASASR